MARRPVSDLPSLTPDEARRIALAAQGFGERRDDKQSSWPRVRAMIDRMGFLQLDSVSTLVRTHYLPAYSRLGNYDRDRLDRHAFAPGPGRQFFEYWAHEASLLPLGAHPLMRWRMAEAAAFEGRYKHFAGVLRDHAGYVRLVEDEIGKRGPIAASELDDPGQRSGPWWGWHKGKSALEFLFLTGRVTAASRRGFERVYDLTERVLPAEILALPTPNPSDAIRTLAGMAAGALGVATEIEIRDYFRLPIPATRQAIADLVEAGDLIAVDVDGWNKPAYLAAGARAPSRINPTSLVSPFDPLVWHRPRTERLFDFYYRIELYTPAPKRKFGYYVLPFLHRGRLAARADLKADRAAGTLLVQGAYAEKDAHRDSLATDLAAELRHLALWLGLSDIKVGKRGDLSAEVVRHI